MKINLRFVPPIKVLLMLITILILVSVSSLSFADKWEQKADMPTARVALSVAEVNGKIYAIGGMTPNGGISAIEEYDPITNKWTNKTNMPTARFCFTSTVVDGKIYAIGGIGRETVVEEYDPTNDSWKTKTSIPSPKNYHSAVSINDKIYVIGGLENFNNMPPSLKIFVYDPKLDQWLQLNDIPAQFSIIGAATVVFQDNIYFFGGTNAIGFTRRAKILIYNTKNETWKELNETITPRSLPVAGIINDKVYIIGGSEDLMVGVGVSIVEEYDIKNNVITKKLDMPNRRGWISGCVVNNNIYVLGGTTDFPGAMPNDYLNINQVYTSDEKISVTPQDKLSSAWGKIKARN